MKKKNPRSARAAQMRAKRRARKRKKKAPAAKTRSERWLDHPAISSGTRQVLTFGEPCDDCPICRLMGQDDVTDEDIDRAFAEAHAQGGQTVMAEEDAKWVDYAQARLEAEGLGAHPDEMDDATSERMFARLFELAGEFAREQRTLN